MFLTSLSRRLTAMALAAALFFGMIPVNTAHAETAGPCEHLPTHQEGCSYAPAKEAVPCEVCTADEAGEIRHGGEGCTWGAAADEVPCTCTCPDCEAAAAPASLDEADTDAANVDEANADEVSVAEVKASAANEAPARSDALAAVEQQIAALPGLYAAWGASIGTEAEAECYADFSAAATNAWNAYQALSAEDKARLSQEDYANLEGYYGLVAASSAPGEFDGVVTVHLKGISVVPGVHSGEDTNSAVPNSTIWISIGEVRKNERLLLKIGSGAYGDFPIFDESTEQYQYNVTGEEESITILRTHVCDLHKDVIEWIGLSGSLTNPNAAEGSYYYLSGNTSIREPGGVTVNGTVCLNGYNLTGSDVIWTGTGRVINCEAPGTASSGSVGTITITAPQPGLTFAGVDCNVTMGDAQPAYATFEKCNIYGLQYSGLSTENSVLTIDGGTVEKVLNTSLLDVTLKGDVTVSSMTLSNPVSAKGLDENACITLDQPETNMGLPCQVTKDDAPIARFVAPEGYALYKKDDGTIWLNTAYSLTIPANAGVSVSVGGNTLTGTEGNAAITYTVAAGATVTLTPTFTAVPATNNYYDDITEVQFSAPAGFSAVSGSASDHSASFTMPGANVTISKVIMEHYHSAHDNADFYEFTGTLDSGNGYYFMTSDWGSPERPIDLTVRTGEELWLCLNGHQFYGNITVEAGAIFNPMDCSADAGASSDAGTGFIHGDIIIKAGDTKGGSVTSQIGYEDCRGSNRVIVEGNGYADLRYMYPSSKMPIFLVDGASVSQVPENGNYEIYEPLDLDALLTPKGWKGKLEAAPGSTGVKLEAGEDAIEYYPRSTLLTVKEPIYYLDMGSYQPVTPAIGATLSLATVRAAYAMYKLTVPVGVDVGLEEDPYNLADMLIHKQESDQSSLTDTYLVVASQDSMTVPVVLSGFNGEKAVASCDIDLEFTEKDNGTYSFNMPLADVEVTIQEEPEYTIVIPSGTIDLGTGELTDGSEPRILVKSGDDGDTAAYDGKLLVGLTGQYSNGTENTQTGFFVSHGVDRTACVAYSVEVDGQTLTSGADPVVMDYQKTDRTEAGLPVTFKVEENQVTYAGTYSGWLVFDIAFPTDPAA